MLATRGGRPRLRRSIERFPAPDGTLYLLQGGHRDALALPELPDRQRALLAGLDGSRTVDGLAELHPELTADEVTGTLDQLGELGLIEDAGADSDWLDDGERDRYDRQLEYFGELAAGSVSRAACQARLREARVVVIGLGGLGAWALWALAAAGIGRLVGVDGDVVEHSNLNRQTLYREEDLGRPKALATARTIAAFNSAISFEPIRGGSRARTRWPPSWPAPTSSSRRPTGRPTGSAAGSTSCCADAGVPHVGASQFPPLIRVGPTFVPGAPRLPRCLEESARADDPLFDELAAWRQQADTFAATFAPACALIGGVLSSDVIHHITGLAEPSTLGTSLVIDIRTLEQHRVAVEAVPGCADLLGLASLGCWRSTSRPSWARARSGTGATACWCRSTCSPAGCF